MSTFADVTREARAPARTILLEPWVFADDWDGKPDAAVCVGLRLLADGDKTRARGEAEKHADEAHPHRGPNWLDCFNDALMRQAVALCICDPNDTRKPSALLPYAEEQVTAALTSRGARHIFDELERYEIESSPLEEPITDAEIDHLVLLLQTSSERLTNGHRTLLRHVYDALA